MIGQRLRPSLICLLAVALLLCGGLVARPAEAVDMSSAWADLKQLEKSMGRKNTNEDLLQYLDAVTDLSLRLLHAFCLGLGLPGKFLDSEFDGNHTGFVRLNYYPVDDPLRDAAIPHMPTADMGVHHHTDAGALTVLLQDDIGGLQVHHDNQWHEVPPIDGAFVINTGDMMQVWSNDKYQSPVHRVLPMHSTDRYSLPFFFNPSAATKVSPLASLLSPDNPAGYRTIEWAEFRGKRTDGDYADYGTEVQIGQYRLP